MLKAKLAQEMKHKGLSTRQVASEIGTSHTTILRALRGEIVDVVTILKMSDWLGIEPSTLINSMASTKAALPEQIAVMLGKYPRLENEFTKAIKAVLEEKVEPEIIEDIVAYAAYKINLRSSGQLE
jgi:transcriptional regulator with XRE-family HTH domain